MQMAESATVRMNRLAIERRAAGHSILDLSAGQPDFPSPRGAVAEAQRALAEGFTRYTAVAGLPDLRSALAEHYRREHDAPWQAADVVVTAGAKAALMQLMLVLLDDGDSAVVPTPAWVSFSEQIRFAGARPILVPTSAEDGFTLRAEPLLEALDTTTRLVLLNSPSNPTGGTMSAGELRRLALACAERGVILVADETYERFVWDGEHHASAARLAAELPETVVVVGSFSKTWAMTGWRVGWLCGPRSIVEKVTAVQSHTFSNVTSFAMRGAVAALEQGEKEVLAMIREFAARRAMVVGALAELPGVFCPNPAGAFYAFPDVSAHFDTHCPGSAALAEQLLAEAGVAVVPGIAFDADRHLRLSFASSREDLAAALDRLGQFFTASARRAGLS